MVSANRISRRRAPGRLGGRRRNHPKTFTPPKSPQSILAHARRNSLTSRRGRGGLFGAGSNTRINHAERKAGGRTSKYSKFGLIPRSTEPFEKNCFEKEPFATGYVFVPKGDVYVTRNCRTNTKESERTVYTVFDKTGKRTLGIRVPSDVYAAVLESAAATAETRANAVKLRDEKDLAHSRELLRTQFPLMPAESLEAILNHAFLKGSGRVGRTATKSDERKADLAVEAHIRHMHTPYESMLHAGASREEARNAVWGLIKAIKTAWEGGDSQPMDALALRNRMVESN
ncbi:hypothetical protein BDV32DRAFT_105663 [Aspergillus pseudonomiae]|uniref:DUF2293 domain-containing protein n=1 Tax=Aspergillus pseudonomiae TaxID=1506151 RepID=A0A5N6HRQ0_9EURO|nr:uncharacterized protein BDV37DRAFT_253528 [Aspergillus pseudonomiae]KAB8256070.1 hypothetical protein BDV32DRAFT_105663 [Aspergillus pseudonomiae]KAE8402032.1 hypothetical protein BDV37DRAFT_253528 [Aspergillus pseudonomiae]